MFGKKKDDERVQAEAEVLTCETRFGSRGAFGNYSRYDVDMRVHLADGSTRDVHEHNVGGMGGTLHSIGVGSVVPVRFPAGAPDKAEVDLDEMQRRHDAAVVHANEVLHQANEESFARGGHGFEADAHDTAKKTAGALEQMSQLHGKLSRGEIDQATFDAEQARIRAELNPGR